MNLETKNTIRVSNFEFRISSGFTLLEMVLAMAVLTILVVGIFGLAEGTIAMTAGVNDFEQNELTRNRFVELCRQHLESIPGGSGLELREIGGNSKNPGSELSFVDSPRAFGFGAAGGAIARVVLEARPPEVRAHYLELDQAVLYEKGNALNQLNATSVTLFRGIESMQWRFFDRENLEWFTEWEDPSILPHFAELTVLMEGEIAPRRTVFWIPPRDQPPAFSAEIEPASVEGLIPDLPQ